MIDYNLILVQDDDLGTYIDIEFYKGDFDNPNTEEVFLLHHKTVDITPPSGGIEVLNEELREIEEEPNEGGTTMSAWPEAVWIVRKMKKFFNLDVKIEGN